MAQTEYELLILGVLDSESLKNHNLYIWNDSGQTRYSSKDNFKPFPGKMLENSRKIICGSKIILKIH